MRVAAFDVASALPREVAKSVDCFLTVVIPAYNEEDRIVGTLDLVRFPDVRVLSCRENHGKGYAVRCGMGVACGQYRLVYDADSSTPIAELGNAWNTLIGETDIVVGSRKIVGSKIETRQPIYRRIMGNSYNTILKLLGLTQMDDTQCGFKLFSAESAEVVFPRQRIDRFGSDAEWLYIADIHGLHVSEMPIEWDNATGSKVRIIKDSLYMFVDAIATRRNGWMGRYD